MLGFKKKEKKVETKETAVPVNGGENAAETANASERVNETISETERSETETTGSAEAEKTAVKEKEEFNLARILGKTESGLQKEFYVYQIKELMKSVCMTLPKSGADFAFAESVFPVLIKFGVEETAVTPFYFEMCRDLEVKFGKNKMKFGALIDFPNGESSFKARAADVKFAAKAGVDRITVALPQSAVSSGYAGGLKRTVAKLAKLTNKRFGVGINIGIGEENIKKTARLIEGMKISHLAVFARGVPLDLLKDDLAILGELKRNAELHVYADVSGVEEVSALFEKKVDKIFTPFVKEIGDELQQKFGTEF